MPELNIGVHYDTQTDLEFETTVHDNKGLLLFTDGDKKKKNMAAKLGLGISYNILPALAVNLGGNYYFGEQADEGKDEDGENGIDDDQENGYDAMISVDYKVTPDLVAGLGFQYTDEGGNKKTYDDFSMDLNSRTIAGGVKYTAPAGLDLTLAFAYAMYEIGENEDGSIEYNKQAMVLALAVQYKAF